LHPALFVCPARLRAASDGVTPPVGEAASQALNNWTSPAIASPISDALFGQKRGSGRSNQKLSSQGYGFGAWLSLIRSDSTRNRNELLKRGEVASVACLLRSFRG